MTNIYAEHILDAYQLFHDGTLALAEAEQQGMRVSVEYIKKKSKQIDHKITKLESVIYDSEFFRNWQNYSKSKVNIYSPKQLEMYLYTCLKLKAKKQTKSGHGSTDEESLAQLNIAELDTFLEIKKLKKLKDTYLDGFLREQIDGFIHPFFTLHLVKTYRGASSNPNFQNIPKRDKESMKTIRGALFPRIDYQLLELDYSQLEVRIAQAYHNDPTMLEYLETGHDMHKDIAVQIFCLKEYDATIHKELRQASKGAFVFAQFYGDYYKNCAKNLTTNWCKLPESKWKSGQGIIVGDEHISDLFIRSGITSYAKFESHLEKIENDFWGNRFPIYDRWKETWWRAYQRDGYFLSKTGFLFTGVMSRNDATNYPVQGAAFHVLLWCLIQATNELKEYKMKSKIVGQIHDAIVMDVCPTELDDVVAMMKRIMEKKVRKHWSWINVPLKIEAELCPVNASWAEKQEYKI